MFADLVSVVEDAEVRHGGEDEEEQDEQLLFHGVIMVDCGERCKPLLIQTISLEVDEGDLCGLAVGLCDLLV